MTTEGWIFMVGLRVFDVGALIVWLVWFFRLRNEDDDEGEDSGGGNDRVGPPQGPGGDGIPLSDADPWPQRRRDHGGDRPPATAPARRGLPARPAPARPARQPVGPARRSR